MKHSEEECPSSASLQAEPVGSQGRALEGLSADKVSWRDNKDSWLSDKPRGLLQADQEGGAPLRETSPRPSLETKLKGLHHCFSLRISAYNPYPRK